MTIGFWTAGTAARADAPAVIPLQGTLAEADGRPVQGVRTLTFTIHDSETGGTPLWTETQDVDVVDGMLSVLVGDAQPLDLALFRDNGVLWMEIAVDASPPFPRMQLGTTPYAAFAQYAGDARSVGGVAAGELARTGHEHDDRYYTEAELGAAGSASVHWGNLAGVPAGFADGVDNDTTYSAGLGLQLTGTRFSADPLYLEDRARAVCYDTPAELQAELDSVYAPASHPTPWTTLTGVPAGFADGVDADTTYSAGAGLTLTGTTFAVAFGGSGTAATAARSDHAHALPAPLTWALAAEELFLPSGASGWSNNTVTTCGWVTMLGGYNVISGGCLTKTFAGLPAHAQMRVAFNYHFVDSWDGEEGYLLVDAVRRWGRTAVFSGAPSTCGAGWGETLQYSVDVEFPHAAGSAVVAVCSSLDQAAADESFGFGNLRIYVR